MNYTKKNVTPNTRGERRSDARFVQKKRRKSLKNFSRRRRRWAAGGSSARKGKVESNVLVGLLVVLRFVAAEGRERGAARPLSGCGPAAHAPKK
jgi:hypothetical protein